MSGLCMGLCIIFNLRILRHMPHAVDYMFDKKMMFVIMSGGGSVFV